MKAVVTNKKEEFKYTIENVVTINYVENRLIIVSIDDDQVYTHKYYNEDVIVAIA